MTYTDVITNQYNLILKKKKKYTKKDVDKLVKMGFELKQALFITRCTAIYHDTEYSKVVGLSTDEYILKYLYC